MSSSITVEDMNTLAEKIKSKEEQYAAAKTVSNNLDRELNSLYEAAAEALLELGQPSFRTPFGTLQTRTRRSFKIPHGKNRDEFFGKLKEMGVFDDMITVPSPTLNAFLKADFEAAEARGEDMVTYKFPGIELPTEKVTTTLIKAR